MKKKHNKFKQRIPIKHIERQMFQPYVMPEPQKESWFSFITDNKVSFMFVISGIIFLLSMMSFIKN